MLLLLACTGSADPKDSAAPDTPASAAIVAESVAVGVGGAASMSVPLSDAARAIFRDSLSREEDVQSQAEEGIAGNSIVTDATCVGFEWSGLSATVTFTGCTVEATGESLDGAVTLAVTTQPVTLGFTLTDLVIGGNAVAGTVTLSASGDRTAATLAIAADLSFTTADGAATLALTDVTGVADANGMTLDGTGTLTTSTVTAAFTMTSLHWATGECLPSSGTVVYDEVTITFLDTTPETGVVQVQVGRFPATEEELLEPCP